MTTDPTGFISAIGTTLTAESWTRVEDSAPSAEACATVYTGPDRTTRLAITSTPGEPRTAELTGHPARHPTTTIWSLSITDPTAAQLLPIARAAAHHRLREVLTVADRLQQAG